MNNKVPLRGTFGVLPETILAMLNDDVPYPGGLPQLHHTRQDLHALIRPKTNLELKIEKREKKARRTAKVSRRKNRK